MTILLVIIVIFSLVFVLIRASLMIGLILEWKRDKNILKIYETTKDEHVPLVSVLIPVHNEALRITPLFESIAVQDYPNYEIIFIDDRSTDESPQMLLTFAKQNSHTKIMTLTENPGINKKQYALTKGMELVRGELVLFTDTDCKVPKRWISAMAARMTDPNTGVMIAPVFKQYSKKNFFHLYQCFDHIVRYIYLASSIGLGAAGGGFGNNMIMRKKALDAIGGYDKVPPSPTEDAALVSMIRSVTSFQVRAACGEEVFVVTGDEKKRIDFISQTLRWNNGGLFSPDILTRFNFNYLMLSITFCVLAIPLMFFFPIVWPMVAAVYMVIGMDTISALTIFRKGIPKAGLAYVFQFLFTPIYFAFLTILGYLHIKPKWKGNKI
ncbi:MAG: glycosyltransferase [Treponema sp.]|jgi:cellulose synthase/poly-beta-1,6-N-acetylglucosamine synthase-like glycosyltransferase|nr:glycosyltransferase [Treponema sp.]